MLSDNGAKAGKINSPAIVNGKISIIIVTLNTAETLQKSLDSVYMQAYQDIEIIVMDGGSADDTVNVIEKNSKRIAYWKSDADQGIYDAMNKALGHITGQWVYFLGADDVLFPEFSLLANELKNPNAIYYGSVLTKGLKRFGKISAYYIAKIGIFHQAIIYPAAVFKKYRYDLKYKVFADHALNMYCFKSFEWVFKDYIIANFNHTGLSALQHDDAFEKDKPRLIRENFGLIIWVRFLVKKLKNNLFKKRISN